MKKLLRKNFVIGKNNLREIKHYAVIPARRDSVGIPFKNRKFFERKIDFLKKITFFNDIIVSSNDNLILNKCKKKNITFVKRSEKLSRANISIKSVFIDIIKKFKFSRNDYLWLFYIPLIYNSKLEIIKSKQIIENKKIDSLCGFINVKTHPYNAWSIKGNKLKKLHNNDFFRRQDLPKMYEHHHNICAFRSSFIDKLNSELIGSFTYPFILSEDTQNKIIELDTREDYKKYLKNVK